MNTKSILSYFIVVSLLLCANVTKAGYEFAPTEKQYQSVFELDAKDLINLDRKGLEKKINRKLSLKERLLLRSVKRKLKKNADLTGKNALNEAETDKMAKASLIVGIVVAGLIGSMFLLGSTLGLQFIIALLLGVVGLILSLISLRRIRKSGGSKKGKWLAIIGLILSSIPAFLVYLIFSRYR